MFPMLFSEVRNERMLDKFYKYEFQWIQRICYEYFKLLKIIMISKVHHKSLSSSQSLHDVS